jgi:hypothetical protein
MKIVLAVERQPSLPRYSISVSSVLIVISCKPCSPISAPHLLTAGDRVDVDCILRSLLRFRVKITISVPSYHGARALFAARPILIYILRPNASDSADRACHPRMSVSLADFLSARCATDLNLVRLRKR